MQANLWNLIFAFLMNLALAVSHTASGYYPFGAKFIKSEKFFLIFIEQKGHRAHFCSKNRFLSILQDCDNPPTFGRGGYHPPERLISNIFFTGYETNRIR